MISRMSLWLIMRSPWRLGGRLAVTQKTLMAQVHDAPSATNGQPASLTLSARLATPGPHEAYGALVRPALPGSCGAARARLRRRCHYPSGGADHAKAGRWRNVRPHAA